MKVSNVLIINYEYPPVGGGAATASSHMANELVSMGKKVGVLTAAFRDKRGITKEAGIDLYRVPCQRKHADHCTIFEMASFIAKGCLWMKKIVRDFKPDFTIAYFTIPSAPLAYLAHKRFGIPYIVSLRGGDVPGFVPEVDGFHKLLSPLRRLILRNSSSIVANSNALAGLSQQADPFDVNVIPNGVDIEFYEEASIQRNTSRDQINFLSVGRFHAQKNYPAMLKTLARLKEKNLLFHLTLVGDGPDADMLKSLASQLEIQDFITWLGWVDKPQLKDLYRNNDCLITTSLNEGMSNVLLEAMASGMAVIASDAGGNKELVLHEKNGLVFPANDPDEFLNCMIKIYQEPVLMKTLGENASKHIKDHYSLRSVADGYMRLMESNSREK